MTCEVVIDPATQKVKKITLFDLNGKKLNLKKTYRVVSNSYTVAVSPTNRADQGQSVGITTPDIIKNYLEHQKKISFQGRKCLVIK